MMEDAGTSDRASAERPEAVGGVEIRLGDGGSLDEVVSQTCGVHLEQMDTNHWWLAVNYPDGSGRVTVGLHARGKITAFVDRERWSKPSPTASGNDPERADK